jgi:hypothetical protein
MTLSNRTVDELVDNPYIQEHIAATAQHLHEAGVLQIERQVAGAAEEFKDFLSRLDKLEAGNPSSYYDLAENALQMKKAFKQQARMFSGRRKKTFEKLLDILFGSVHESINLKDVLQATTKDETLTEDKAEDLIKSYVLTDSETSAFGLTLQQATLNYVVNKTRHDEEEQGGSRTSESFDAMTEQAQEVLEGKAARIRKRVADELGVQIGTENQNSGLTSLFQTSSSAENHADTELQGLQSFTDYVSDKVNHATLIALKHVTNTFNTTLNDLEQFAHKTRSAGQKTRVAARIGIVIVGISAGFMSIAPEAAHAAEPGMDGLDVPTELDGEDPTLAEALQAREGDVITTLVEESVTQMFATDGAAPFAETLAQEVDQHFSQEDAAKFAERHGEKHIDKHLSTLLQGAFGEAEVSAENLTIKQSVTVTISDGDGVQSQATYGDFQAQPTYESGPSDLARGVINETSFTSDKTHISKDALVGAQPVTVQGDVVAAMLNFDFQETSNSLTEDIVNNIKSLSEEDIDEKKTVRVEVNRFFIPKKQP